MIDTDFTSFESAFRRLSGSLNRKFTTVEYRSTVQIFFDALAQFDLADVLAAEPILKARSRWPKVGDWIAAIPVKTITDNVRVMSTTEVDTYMDALRRHYNGDPCNCVLCLDAGVSTWPIRFVPDFTPDDTEDRAFCRPLNRIAVSGHWAHGGELLRWYAARDQFFASAPPVYKRAVRRALRLVPREPGEDG